VVSNGNILLVFDVTNSIKKFKKTPIASCTLKLFAIKLISSSSQCQNAENKVVCNFFNSLLICNIQKSDQSLKNELIILRQISSEKIKFK